MNTLEEALEPVNPDSGTAMPASNPIAALTTEPPPDAEPEEDEPALPSPRPWPRPDQYQSVQRVFALLIAIDHYEMPGANLGGCVQDSIAVENYLRESTESAGERLHLMTLRSPLPSQVDQATGSGPTPASLQKGAPTRAGIIKAFQDFLTKAGEGDAVFIHFSGHGSFEQRPKELWHLDDGDDHRAESLVCQDSYTTQDGNYIPALRDKEIRWLLAQVAERNPHIVLMMDCCNSSGNTRFKEEGTLARFTASPEAQAQNTITDYVFYQQDPFIRAQLENEPAQFQLAEGRHVALYACHSYQLAKETLFSEGKYGVFTYFLLQTLRATQGHITYRDLLKLVREKAIQKVAFQSPQYHCSERPDAELVFLGGSTAGQQDAYTLSPTDQPNDARLDAGSLHGLLSPAEGDTYFTVLPASTEAWSTEDTEDLRQAKLKTLAADHAIVTFTDGQGWPEGTALLKAKVQSTPLVPTKIVLELEDEEALKSWDDLAADFDEAGARTAAEQLKEMIEHNPHLKLVDKADGGWDFRLFLYRYQGDNKVRITELDKIEALIQPKMGWAKATLQAVVDELTHIAKWKRTLGLQNSQPTIIQPGMVDLEVIDAAGEVLSAEGGEVTLHFEPGGAPPKLKFKAVLRQPIRVPLYCALLHLQADYGVETGLLPDDAHLGNFSFIDGGGRIAQDRTEIYAGSHIPVHNGQTQPEGLYLEFTIPPQADGSYPAETLDHFKLLVSTEQFDALNLWQNSLQMSDTTRVGRPQQVLSNFDHLLQEVQTRAAGWATAAAQPATKPSDWWSTTVTVRTKLR